VDEISKWIYVYTSENNEWTDFSPSYYIEDKVEEKMIPFENINLGQFRKKGATWRIHATAHGQTTYSTTDACGDAPGICHNDAALSSVSQI